MRGCIATVVRFDILVDLPDDAAGIAGGEHILGQVAGHDAAGADDRAGADPHPGQMIAPPPTQTSEPI